MELIHSEHRPNSVPDRDADAIPEELAQARTFPTTSGKRGSGMQVVCSRIVLQAIHQHGAETHEVEVCGVLVGNICRDDHGLFLWIQACIRGEHAVNQMAQVTFTSETWTHIHEEMAKWPDMRILGWYHTHPDFGIFLSAADLFIHENFFNLPWQLAYVYDPVREEDGMFVWRKGKAEQEPYCVHEDVHPKAPDGLCLTSERYYSGTTHYSRRLPRINAFV